MRVVLIMTVLLMIVGFCPGQAVDLEKVKLIEVSPGRYCKWSPDGRYLSFASGEGLMVYVVDSGTVRQVAPADQVRGIHWYNYEWSGPDELLFVRRERADQDNVLGDGGAAEPLQNSAPEAEQRAGDDRAR